MGVPGGDERRLYLKWTQTSIYIELHVVHEHSTGTEISPNISIGITGMLTLSLQGLIPLRLGSGKNFGQWSKWVLRDHDWGRERLEELSFNFQISQKWGLQMYEPLKLAMFLTGWCMTQGLPGGFLIRLMPPECSHTIRACGHLPWLLIRCVKCGKFLNKLNKNY